MLYLKQEELLNYLEIPRMVLYRYARSRIHDEDLIQTCYIAMLRSLDHFHGESSLSTYLYAVCKYTLFRYRGLNIRQQKPGSFREGDQDHLPVLPAAVNNLSDNRAQQMFLQAERKMDWERLNPSEQHLLNLLAENNFRVTRAALKSNLTLLQYRKALFAIAHKLGLIPQGVTQADIPRYRNRKKPSSTAKARAKPIAKKVPNIILTPVSEERKPDHEPPQPKSPSQSSQPHPQSDH